MMPLGDGWGRLGRHVVFLTTCLASFGCGNALDLAQDPDGGRNKVSGRITAVNIASDTRDIIVFVYTDLCATEEANPAVCDDLQLPEDLPLLTEDDYRGVQTDRVRATSGGRFLVKRVRNGDLTVAYLQDSATDPDETIDPEDVTVTRDAEGNIIPDAANAVAVMPNRNDFNNADGTVVRLPDVDIDFPSAFATAPTEGSTTSSSTSSTSSTSVTSVTSPPVTSTSVTSTTLPSD